MFDGRENNAYFCIVVGDAMQAFLSLQSTNPSPIMILEWREPVGSLQKRFTAPPYAWQGLLQKKIMKNTPTDTELPTFLKT